MKQKVHAIGALAAGRERHGSPVEAVHASSRLTAKEVTRLRAVPSRPLRFACSLVFFRAAPPPPLRGAQMLDPAPPLAAPARQAASIAVHCGIGLLRPRPRSTVLRAAFDGGARAPQTTACAAERERSALYALPHPSRARRAQPRAPSPSPCGLSPARRHRRRRPMAARSSGAHAPLGRRSPARPATQRVGQVRAGWPHSRASPRVRGEWHRFEHPDGDKENAESAAASQRKSLQREPLPIAGCAAHVWPARASWLVRTGVNLRPA